MRPGRVGDGETALTRLLRGLAELGPARLEIADQILLLEAERLLAAHATLPAIELVRLEPNQPAFAQTGVDAELDMALGQEVPLAGGGRLLIEPTAACVTVDVDGAGRAPLDVDLAATSEIARQVRLRNLGGTIVIDFVDLPSRPERQRLEEALRKAFRHDPAPLEIHAMTSLGLVTLSRARRGAALADRFMTPCERCGGIGLDWSPRIAAERAVALLRAETAPVARVRMSPAAKTLLEKAPAWRETTERLGYVPDLVGDAGLHGAQVQLEGAADGR
jgi:Rne/Rng family ribonuclease